MVRDKKKVVASGTKMERGGTAAVGCWIIIISLLWALRSPSSRAAVVRGPLLKTHGAAFRAEQVELRNPMRFLHPHQPKGKRIE